MNMVKTISSSLTQDGSASTRHFLRDDDLNPEEYKKVLELALEFKQNRYLREPFKGNQGVAIIFDKNSTRTRVSFATGVSELGGYPLIIDSSTSQLSRGEPIADTAHVLERMCSMIVWRTFGQQNVIDMASNSKIPVINSLTDDFHPCQILADLATIAEVGSSKNLNQNGSIKKDCEYSKLSSKEKVNSIVGKTLVYLGDGANNMAHSYLLGCANAGVNVRICCPNEYSPAPQIVKDAVTLGNRTGASVEVVDKVNVENADIITTDAWLSMGMDKGEANIRKDAFLKYQVNEELMNKANEGSIFLHCLPAYRGQEVTSNVIDNYSLLPHQNWSPTNGNHQHETQYNGTQKTENQIPELNSNEATGNDRCEDTESKSSKWDSNKWGSAVWEEAGFRLHAQKALMAFLMDKNK